APSMRGEVMRRLLDRASPHRNRGSVSSRPSEDYAWCLPDASPGCTHATPRSSHWRCPSAPRAPFRICAQTVYIHAQRTHRWTITRGTAMTLNRSLFGAIALAAALVMTALDASAFDESKYPAFQGQWKRKLGTVNAWDESNGHGLPQ